MGKTSELCKKGINFAVYYLGWFITVFGAAHDFQYIAMGIALILLGINALIYPPKKSELIFIGVLIAFGFCIDSGYIIFNMIQFSSPNPFVAWGAPLWILMLYVLFAISLCHSLSWVNYSMWITAIGGGCGGVVSYFYGAKMGAMCFSVPLIQGLITIGIVWALLLPSVVLLKKKIERLEE